MIRIVHLYPRELNIYGDQGNVITLLARCRWRAIEAEIKHYDIGETLHLQPGDIIFIGGGQDKGQEVIADDLQSNAETLRQAIQAGLPALAICGGYQLFGHYFQTAKNKKLSGISLFDAHTIAGLDRLIGNVVVTSKIFGQLVGFENHSGQTWLANTQAELGVVTRGNGNNGQDNGEGALLHHAIGTYLHGPLLPKNPQIADWLIQAAMEQKGQSRRLKSLDDGLEHQAATLAARLPQ